MIENRLFVEDKTWWTTCPLIRPWWRWAWWIQCSTSSACNKWWWCRNSKDNRHSDTWALLLLWLLLPPTATAMHPTSHPRRKSHLLAMFASSAHSQAIGSTTAPMCLKGSLCSGQAVKGSVHYNHMHRVSPLLTAFFHHRNTTTSNQFEDQDGNNQKPQELTCMICDKLMTDAVVVPCCGKSFCKECRYRQLWGYLEDFALCFTATCLIYTTIKYLKTISIINACFIHQILIRRHN